MVQFNSMSCGLHIAREAFKDAFTEASKHKADAHTALSAAFKKNITAQEEGENAPVSLKDRASNMATFAKHAAFSVLFAMPIINAIAYVVLYKNNSSLLHAKVEEQIEDVSEPILDNGYYFNRLANGLMRITDLPADKRLEFGVQGLIGMGPMVNGQQTYTFTERGDVILGHFIRVRDLG